MDTAPFASKTLDLADLHAAPVAAARAQLRRFALRLGAANVPFAVNGVLRRRLLVRPHKMWEYARVVACVLQKMNARRGPAARSEDTTAAARAKERRRFRVLDFGGGATLPVFYLAQQNCDVWCLDVDAALANWSNQLGWKRGWRLRALTHDLTAAAAPGDWGQFDAVISCSVLEHIPKARQAPLLERLAALLKPHGVFCLTCDFGVEAPVEAAIRTEAEMERLVAACGLRFLAGGGFRDTGARFALDKRHPRKRFTFASLFLQKR
jgi:SAM-dependent methyltransferase